MQQVRFTVAEAIELLQDYEDKSTLIYLPEWSDEDIRSAFDDLEDIRAAFKKEELAGGSELSDADISGIFALLDRQHDATVGINWSVIEEAIRVYFQDRANKVAA